VKKKILIGIAVLVVAFAGPVVAWQLVGDEPRRQGSLTTSGVSGWEKIRKPISGSIAIPAFQEQQIYITCPAGKTVLAGGFESQDSLGVEVNAPLDWKNWSIRLWNGSASTRYVVAWLSCANHSY
jgi:hypothetical protein